MVLAVFGLEDVTDKPQTSWATISSIVNTMLGTTIVALPYAFVQTGGCLSPVAGPVQASSHHVVSDAGVALGVLIMCGVGIMACFTCILVVKHGRVRYLCALARRCMGLMCGRRELHRTKTRTQSSCGHILVLPRRTWPGWSAL